LTVDLVNNKNIPCTVKLHNEDGSCVTARRANGRISLDINTRLRPDAGVSS